MPNLRADGIVCSFGDRVVLRDFSLASPSGSLTALLGPNGAGKTTALRTLSRLLRPRQGGVSLDGREIWQIPQRNFVRRVAFVPQAETYFWPMTVEQLVLLGRIPHRGWLLPYSREDHEALQSALRSVEISDLRHRDLSSLSGGERRRAMLARALAQNAEVLLLDEPGAHLDLRHQLELFALLRRLSQEYKVIIVLTLHDLNVASLFADHVVLMREGCIVAQGPPSEIMTGELIRATFGIEVAITLHPLHQVPMVLPILRGGVDHSRNTPGVNDSFRGPA